MDRGAEFHGHQCQQKRNAIAGHDQRKGSVFFRTQTVVVGPSRHLMRCTCKPARGWSLPPTASAWVMSMSGPMPAVPISAPSDGPLRDADALVWDLRDGWGGAEPQYLDLFNPNAPTMQVTDRGGHTRIQDVKWRKPVVMLVNRGTRSGKEVLAYGFKLYRLGEIIGTQTAGAVLAASVFLMSDGDPLLLALRTCDLLFEEKSEAAAD
jgi:hypothetical protein